jgi:hypothetical protein
MIFKNTIVSSFLANVNTIYPSEKYLKDGILLLKAKIPKIIFIDENIYDELKKYENDSSCIIPIKKKDLYFNDYKDSLENFDLNTNNKTKDSLEYMFTMCNKTEWIKKAIELNKFDTDSFIWIDFGIRYIFKNDSDESFIEKIEKLKDKEYEKIRIGSIWDIHVHYSLNIYKDISWYFAGGVFGGKKELLLEFADKTKNKCIEVITEQKTIMWEVNIWYMIYLENQSIFNCYKCDHNESLIINY